MWGKEKVCLNGSISTGSWTCACAWMSNQAITLQHLHLHIMKRNGIICSQINSLPSYTSSLLNMALWNVSLLTNKNLIWEKRLSLDPGPLNTKKNRIKQNNSRRKDNTLNWKKNVTNLVLNPYKGIPFIIPIFPLITYIFAKKGICVYPHSGWFSFVWFWSLQHDKYEGVTVSQHFTLTFFLCLKKYQPEFASRE